MDGPAAEHVREALPVLAGYADVLAVRAFASLSDLDADLADEPMATFDRLVPGPLVNLESAVDHPCQALGDWKAMDDLGVAGDVFRLTDRDAKRLYRFRLWSLAQFLERGNQLCPFRPELLRESKGIKVKAPLPGRGGLALGRRKQNQHRGENLAEPPSL